MKNIAVGFVIATISIMAFRYFSPPSLNDMASPVIIISKGSELNGSFDHVVIVKDSSGAIYPLTEELSRGFFTRNIGDTIK